MASGRQVTYTLNLNSNVIESLNKHEAAASRLDDSMWQLQKTLSAFGLGLGTHYLKEFVEDAIKGASEYETAMLRIKNASQDAFTGIKNQMFINNEVDLFKIKLDETVDSYGKFIFKIKNAGISNHESNKLFNEILAVGKIAGLSNQEMSPVVNNIGTMLSEGVLEARHLRALSNTHPQLLPYLAEILGLDKKAVSDAADTENESSALQKFSRLLSTGKLTKAGVDSKVFLEAFEKYYNDVKEKLPETLHTLSSETNELSNSWERFKKSIVLTNKPEVVDFIHQLGDGVKWLTEHEDGIITWTERIGELVKLFIEWKLVMAGFQIPNMVAGFFSKEFGAMQNSIGSSLNFLGGKSTIEEEMAIKKLADSELDAAIESSKLSTQTNILSKTQSAETQEAIKMSEAIAKQTLQMDLFTQAQISNISSTEKLSREWIQFDMFNNNMEANDAAFIGHGTRSSNPRAWSSGHGLHDRYSILTESEIEAEKVGMAALANNMSATTSQGRLFSESVMSSAVGEGLVTKEMREQQYLLERNNALLGEQLALADAESMAMGSMNMYAGVGSGLSKSSILSGIGKGANSIIAAAGEMVVPVMIAAMAADVLLALAPKGEYSKEEMGYKDVWDAIDKIMTTDPVHEIKMDRIIAQREAKEDISNIARFFFDRKHALSQTSDGKLYLNLKEKGNDFSKFLQIEQNVHKNIDVLKNAGLWDEKYGVAIEKTNLELIEYMRKFYGLQGYLVKDKEKDEKTKTNKQDIRKLTDKNSDRIKGNSSNYITINITEMNGIKTVEKIEVGEGGSDPKQLEDTIGTVLTKIMTDVVNDSQFIGVRAR